MGIQTHCVSQGFCRSSVVPRLRNEAVTLLETRGERDSQLRLAHASGYQSHVRIDPFEKVTASTGRVWVKLRFLPIQMYAEDGEQAPSVLPVFASVLKSALAPVGELRSEASQLAVAIAAVVERPVANVHVIYEPPAVGRIAFGGDLMAS